VDIRVSAAGIRGLIKAFLRPSPHEQPGYAELASCIEPGEFSGQRALVIGGSRGLGEVAAKLLAAGGATVMITYHRGRDDAQRIVNEIRTQGGDADHAHFDVLKPDADLADIESRGPAPTHCYYFATPFVFSGVKGVFSAELFDKFVAYYVTGFANTVEHWRRLGVRHYFYPSTVAVDESPLNMGEYTAAKSAGESLCAFLEKSDPGLTFYRPRLPRAATDQTVSLLPVENRDPVELMRGELRRFRARSAAKS
jgi:hypothetical protein